MSDFGAIIAVEWAGILVFGLGCILLLAERAARRLASGRREWRELHGPVRTQLRTEATPSPRVRTAPAGRGACSPPVPPPSPQVARPTPGARRLGPTSGDAGVGAASPDSRTDRRTDG